MLRIDRVRTEMHLVPEPAAASPIESGTSMQVDAEALRPLLLQILREELRALERRGTL
jgi:DNA-binding transcriptional regulator YdaS (Cro superfamily)